MANAPAGWYRDESAPGGKRYWNGASWAETLPAQATGPVDFLPQAPIFAPAAAAVTAAVFQPAPVDHFTPTPRHAEPAFQPMSTENYAAVEQEQVPWDVVGVQRQPETAITNPSQPSHWRPPAQHGYEAGAGYGSAANFGSVAYSPQSSISYGGPPKTSKRWSGAAKVLVTLATVAVVFAVRWAFGLFFGGDFSNDGRIEVAPPVAWTTYTASDPDISYAMDARWPDLTTSGLVAMPSGARLIDARTLSANASNQPALVLITTTTGSVDGAKVSREIFEFAFDEFHQRVRSSGVTVDSIAETRVLKSRAGDSWGFSSVTGTLEGVSITFYDAVAVVGDYIVEVGLIAPHEAGLSENDILAIVNSIEAQ